MTQNITFITDYQKESEQTLVTQFANKIGFKNYLLTIIPLIQELENVFQDLYLYRNIEFSYGIQLDGLGQILGLERNSLNDDDYRKFLKFQAYVNTSKGESELLIEAVKFFTNSSYVILYEIFPCNCYAYINNQNFAITDVFNTYMDKLCMGGVRWLGTNIGNEQPFILDELYSVDGSAFIYGGFSFVDASNNLIDDGTCGLLSFFI
jgi:hypothetical protein